MAASLRRLIIRPPQPPTAPQQHRHRLMFARSYRDADLAFVSRRSPVYATQGAVACTQPLASEAGLHVLRSGGNAADAAVAMAAALNVTEPCSTGIGGDAFCLFYDAKAKDVRCVLGNGRSPADLTPDLLRARGFEGGVPASHALNITCPGAAAAWCDISERFGEIPIADALAPAIRLAKEGFPVGPITSGCWAGAAHQIINSRATGTDPGELLLPDGSGSFRAPRAGEIFRNPNLARVFEEVAAKGKAGFYLGWVANAIADAVEAADGVLNLADLASHDSDFQEPIRTTYKGIEIYEVPPPTHGLVALLALNLMEAVCDGVSEAHGPALSYADRLHVDIESVRLAFAEGVKHIADPRGEGVPDLGVEAALSKAAAEAMSAAISRDAATDFGALWPAERSGGAGGKAGGSPVGVGPDTVYFCAVDRWGNGCSMINSNYMSFGTGIIPRGCGFSLQNRGHGFAHAGSSHPNRVGPNKRPYHTIIPGLATFPGKESLYATFGVMGGFMQPQGHAQVLRNMLEVGMDPQQALDAPRFYVNVADYNRGETLFDAGGNRSLSRPQVFLEQHIGENIAEALRDRGHDIVSQVDGFKRAMFGRGQIIRRDPESGVLTAGSDPRGDGCARIGILGNARALL